jgi:hypothetical protein
MVEDSSWGSDLLNYSGEAEETAPSFPVLTTPAKSILPEYQQAPPDWGFDVGERVAKSAQESFGAIWMGLGALSDSIGMEGARDWTINRSNELFDKAASHDIASTQFSEISNIVDLAKFTAEKVIEYIPDMVLMFAGGAGVGTAATKIAGTGIAKSAAKTFAKKALQKNLKAAAAKSGSSITSAAVKEAAYKATLKEMGTLTGMASFEGFQGTGQMYAQDVALRGVDEASPSAAFLGGGLQAAVAMVSPFNKAMASMSFKKGKTEFLNMTIGEGIEEVLQGGIEKLHEAGLILILQLVR